MCVLFPYLLPLFHRTDAVALVGQEAPAQGVRGREGRSRSRQAVPLRCDRNRWIRFVLPFPLSLLPLRHSNPSLPAVNFALIAVPAFYAYQNWHAPRWDRRIVSAVAVGLGAIFGAEASLGYFEVKKEQQQ
jgi:hypothetical protein